MKHTLIWRCAHKCSDEECFFVIATASFAALVKFNMKCPWLVRDTDWRLEIIEEVQDESR